jgi:hypothetical protein
MDVDPLPVSDIVDVEPAAFIGPSLPGTYFRIIPHPHSTDPTPKIVPLTAGSTEVFTPSAKFAAESRDLRPWFPFKTEANFKVAELVVNGELNPQLTNDLLNGVNNDWITGESRLTLKNSAQLQDMLGSARKYGVRVSLHAPHLWFYSSLPNHSSNTVQLPLRIKVSAKQSCLSTGIHGNGFPL